MWTKRYIFRPAKEEYFKTKHPIAAATVLVPMILYSCITAAAGADRHNWWLAVGFIGCLVFGVGAGYGFAVIRKIYEKAFVPGLCLISGAVLIAVSLVFLF